MNHKTSILGAFFILIIIIGCKQKKTTGFQFPDLIVLERSERPLSLSSYVSDIEYIALRDSQLVTEEFSKIEFYKNLIIIGDYNKSKSICIFDSTGQMVSEIRVGNSIQNEFLSIGSFTVNGQNGDIYVSDVDRRRILTFSIQGVFKQALKVEGDALVSDLEWHKAGLFMYIDKFSDNSTQLQRGIYRHDLTTGDNTLICSTDPQFSNFGADVRKGRVLFTFNDEIIFCPSEAPCTYRLDPKGYQKLFCLESSGSNKDDIEVMNAVGSKGFQMILTRWDEQGIMIFNSRKNGLAQASFILNDLDGIRFDPQLYMHNDFIYTTLSQKSVKEYIYYSKGLENHIQKDRLKGIVEQGNLHINKICDKALDYPILVRMKCL